MDGGIIAEFLAKVGFKADEKSMNASLGKIKAFSMAIAGVAAGAAAAVVKIASDYTELDKAAQRVRAPIEKLEELKYIAEQTGASGEAMVAALGSLADKHPMLKDSSVMLERVSRNMRGMSESARRVYAANMGIDPTLIPMLTRDVSGLKDEYAKMHAVAGINARDAAEAAKGFMAELGKLKTLGTMLANAVGLGVLGKIQGGIEKLRRGVIDNFDRIKRVLEGVIAVCLRITGAVMALAGRIIGWIGKLADWFNTLDEGTQNTILAVGGLLAAWRLLNAGFLATPLGFVIGLLIGLIALIDDFQTYMEGGESLIDWGPYEAQVLSLATAFKVLIRGVKALFKGLEAATRPLLMAIGAGVDGLIRQFGYFFDLIKALFTGDFKGALAAGAAMVQNFVATIKEVFGYLVEGILAYWSQIAAEFPDLGAWAQRACDAMLAIFGGAFDWLKGQMSGLTDWMPDWAKDGLGLNTSVQLERPALTPSPSQAHALGGTNSNVQMEQKTEIKVISGGDPQAVGAAVAARQTDVNAALLRNTVGAVR